MTKYRVILRLKSLEFSQQSIADSCDVSKNSLWTECNTKFSMNTSKRRLM